MLSHRAAGIVPDRCPVATIVARPMERSAEESTLTSFSQKRKSRKASPLRPDFLYCRIPPWIPEKYLFYFSKKVL